MAAWQRASEDWGGGHAAAFHVTNLVPAHANEYWSFAILPDGSGEGWETSERGDQRRAAFKAYLRSTRHEDGSGPLEWAEVQYGYDADPVAVIDHGRADLTPEEQPQSAADLQAQREG